MPITFPSALDTFTNPIGTDELDSLAVPHAEQHADANDAIEALEAKVGVDGSTDPTSLTNKIAALESAGFVDTAHDHVGGDGALIPYLGLDILNSPAESALLSYNLAGDKLEWLSSVYYQPTLLTTVVGTVTNGTLASVITKGDGLIFEVTEVASNTPGFDIRFDFAGVTTFNELRTNVRYSAGHNCELQLWDYTLGTPAYVTQTTVNNQTGLVDVIVQIDNATKYIDGSGNAKMRFYHPATGNGTHLFKLDYLGLIYAVTGGGGVTDHQALSGTTNAGAHPATAISASAHGTNVGTTVQEQLNGLADGKISGSGIASITVGTVAPVTPAVGDVWFDTN